jgi:hypothetical protein
MAGLGCMPRPKAFAEDPTAERGAGRLPTLGSSSGLTLPEPAHVKQGRPVRNAYLASLDEGKILTPAWNDQILQSLGVIDRTPSRSRAAFVSTLAARVFKASHPAHGAVKISRAAGGAGATKRSGGADLKAVLAAGHPVVSLTLARSGPLRHKQDMVVKGDTLQTDAIELPEGLRTPGIDMLLIAEIAQAAIDLRVDRVVFDMDSATSDMSSLFVACQAGLGSSGYEMSPQALLDHSRGAARADGWMLPSQPGR